MGVGLTAMDGAVHHRTEEDSGAAGRTHPTIIERDADRTDLPLVVVPVSIPSMTPLLLDRLDDFAGLARVRIHTDWTADEDVLAARMAGATVAMSTGFRAPASLLERIASDVRCITFCGTGAVSFIDLDAARRLGITVCNAVHYGDNAVAEHAIALMFELTHHAGALNARTHAGGWPAADISELGGRTLGLIGFGGIGRRVARLAHGLGMRLLVWDRRPDADALAAVGATPAVDMDEVFAKADIISLHLALNDGTRGIIGLHRLDLIRPGGMLVNTARAELIEPGAMLARLRRGDITAAVDVTDPEPLPDDDPLRALPNLVITPHVAWRSDRALRALVEQNARSAVAFLRGESYNVIV